MPENMLTVSDAAQRIGMRLDDLMALIYAGEVPARLHDETWRLLLDERDVERLRAQREASPRG